MEFFYPTKGLFKGRLKQNRGSSAYNNYRTNNAFVAAARILFWGFSFVILLQAVFKHKYGKDKSVRLYIDPILLALNKQLFLVLANKLLAVG